MKTHTPGPWSIGKNIIGKKYAHGGFERHIVEKLWDDEQGDADARLIAAAPELLEALIWMVEHDDTQEGDAPIASLGGQSWNEYNAFWIQGLNKARAAIAKATGAQP